MVGSRTISVAISCLILVSCSPPESRDTANAGGSDERDLSYPVVSTTAAPTVRPPETTSPMPEDVDLIRCAQIDTPTERIGCYDELAIVRGYQPPQRTTRSTGKWLVEETSNPIDDTRTVMLLLTAEPNSSSTRMGERPILVARCRSNTTELYINWGQYVGDDSSNVYDEWKYVTIRVGSNEAQRQRWGVSTSRDATFAPNWAGSLLREMTTDTTFVARTTPYGENPMTAIFDTTGLSEALLPLMDTCGWSLGEIQSDD